MGLTDHGRIKIAVPRAYGRRGGQRLGTGYALSRISLSNYMLNRKEENHEENTCGLCNFNNITNMHHNINRLAHKIINYKSDPISLGRESSASVVNLEFNC